MNDKEILRKITEKKEFSGIPKEDVEVAFEKFNKEKYSDEEKVKLTRKLLRDVFSSFSSQKILSLKDKDSMWLLRKHLSTRERMGDYDGVYGRIFKKFSGNVSVIDLGAGINGISYNHFEKAGVNVDYVGIEAIKQLSELVNFYFSKNKISGKSFNLSLFNFKKVIGIIRKTKKPRIVFLFKTIDSLEMLKRNYSIELISAIVPICDNFVLSFATRSMISKRKFKANRKWIIDFVESNFKVTDDFEIGGERYISFSKK